MPAADPIGLNEGKTRLLNDVVSLDPGISQKGELQITIAVINWLLGLVAVFALVAVIVGGIMYITSLGNEQRAERAKKTLLYAVVGLLLIGASFLIISIVKKVLITP